MRTARGALSAAVATLLAAASHALAGGTITPLAVGATALLALPLCVALAGRLGSLWRLGLAVGASQFLYHWSFWGLGAPVVSSGEAAPHHASHLTAVFSPGLVASGAAETWMWAAHAVAAILTVLLLHRGERAALGLARLILRARPWRLPRAIELPSRAPIPSSTALERLSERLAALTPISHRGPPAALAPTH